MIKSIIIYLSMQIHTHPLPPQSLDLSMLVSTTMIVTMTTTVQTYHSLSSVFLYTLYLSEQNCMQAITAENIPYSGKLSWDPIFANAWPVFIEFLQFKFQRCTQSILSYTQWWIQDF